MTTNAPCNSDIMSARFLYQNGMEVHSGSFDIPPTPVPDFESCYVFAFAKAGSVLINNLTYGIMQHAGVPVVDVPVSIFNSGVATSSVIMDLGRIFRPYGYCYAGFRSILPCMRGTIDNLSDRIILMVRDPRDMLVSLYYSIKYSHKFPSNMTPQAIYELESQCWARDVNIDEFCVTNSIIYNVMFKDFQALIGKKKVAVIRYEEAVFDKVALAHTICDKFSISIPLERLKEIVAPHDVLPSEDKPLDHIRQVRPGDHTRKLAPGTIEKLNIMMGEFMSFFGYGP